MAARGDVDVDANVVPRSLAARRLGGRSGRRVPVVRTPRTLPRVLSPAAVDELMGALRTHRDRAMVEAMLLGGLRRCEVLGLRLEDIRVGERRVFVAAATVSKIVPHASVRRSTTIPDRAARRATVPTRLEPAMLQADGAPIAIMTLVL